MMEGSFRLGRVSGIVIGVHYSWLLVFGMTAWQLATHYFPERLPLAGPTVYWPAAVLAALLLFGSVLVHELAHSLVAVSRGIPVRSIILFIFGGVSNMESEAERPIDELVMAVVGPLASFALAASFWLVQQGLLAFPDPPVVAATLTGYLAVVNALLGAFNMVPGFPLDGGRVARSLLWWATGNLRSATRVAAYVGRGIGLLFVVGGLALTFGGLPLNGLWLVLIGWFLENAATMSLRQVALREQFAGVLVRDVMNREPETVPPDTSVRDLVYDYILGRNVRTLPVVDPAAHDQLLGLVTLSDVREVPEERWTWVRVAEVMAGSEGLRTVGPFEPLGRALRLLGDGDLNQVPVVADGRLVGLVTRSDVIRYLRIREELGDLAQSPPKAWPWSRGRAA